MRLAFGYMVQNEIKRLQALKPDDDGGFTEEDYKEVRDAAHKAWDDGEVYLPNNFDSDELNEQERHRMVAQAAYDFVNRPNAAPQPGYRAPMPGLADSRGAPPADRPAPRAGIRRPKLKGGAAMPSVAAERSLKRSRAPHQIAGSAEAKEHMARLRAKRGKTTQGQ